MNWVRTKIEQIKDAYPHTLKTYIFLFFCFAFIGMVWEMGLEFMKTQSFTKTGTMWGPWVPIYGVGGILTQLIPPKYTKNKTQTFLIACVMCSVLEYATSYYLEMNFGVVWWDYSEFLFNIDGRICLFVMLFFGTGCCFLLYYVTPHLVKFFKSITLRQQQYIIQFLIFFFIFDFLYSYQLPNLANSSILP